MHSLPVRVVGSEGWCVRRASCWLISMQPWTPLWASGPSRLLTESCAKDKANISVLRAVCDMTWSFFFLFFLLLSAVSFQYKSVGCISRSEDFCVKSMCNVQTDHGLLSNNVVFGWSGVNRMILDNHLFCRVIDHFIFSILKKRKFLSLWSNLWMPFSGLQTP